MNFRLGPKLKEAGPKIAPLDEPRSSPLTRLDPDGFPILVRGETIAAALDHYRRHEQETIGELVHWLNIWLEKPVVDKTGLTGRYDITLSYVIPSRQSQDGLDAPVPTLIDAVRATGLRIASKKVVVEYEVVASARRVPVEN
jgi:uncharacterized protein (TIGR03435 family)